MKMIPTNKSDLADTAEFWRLWEAPLRLYRGKLCLFQSLIDEGPQTLIAISAFKLLQFMSGLVSVCQLHRLEIWTWDKINSSRWVSCFKTSKDYHWVLHCSLLFHYTKSIYLVIVMVIVYKVSLIGYSITSAIFLC